MRGSDAKTVAAISSVHFIEYCPILLPIKTTSIRVRSETDKREANKYSFHAVINANIPVATIPCFIRGIQILKKVLKGEQPSILADSSNDIGMLLKKLARVSVQNGRVNEIYAIINPIRLSNNPTLTKNL